MAEFSRKWGLPVWLFLLFFIYPIPHTIALRNLFLFVGLIVSLKLIVYSVDWKSLLRLLSPLRGSGWILLILTLWLLIQSSIISPYPQLSLGMLRGDWLIELLVAATGGCAVLACRRDGFSRLLLGLITALSVHIILLLVYQMLVWGLTGTFPFGMTPFAQKDYHSMLATTLIALLLADLASRLLGKGSKSLLPWHALAVMLVLCCAATATLLARNAVIITFVMLLITASVLAFTGRRHIGRKVVPMVVGFLLIAGIVGGFGVRSDARWLNFAETISVAFDTQHNMAWLDWENNPRPLMKDGQPIEESAYLRLAWGKVAIEQIQLYPLGLGYGHKAFGWAVNRTYQVRTGIESSHSGLLDFTLANGIPGLALWLALSGALLFSGWRAFYVQKSPVGLMLAFTVIAYFVRCLLDGHLSGFRLETYALLVGVLAIAQTLDNEQWN